jgi:alpha-beta hydrolase superfamily lysophospholipase
MAEKVVITTSDGVEIVGDYSASEGARAAVLLLHMMPARKESWQPFAAALNAKGLATLAIDLRGHGESTKRGTERLDYSAFSDEEHRLKRLDVEASASWLIAKTGIGFESLALAGASIGANLAIAFAAANWEIPAVLALSPGLNYRGVTTEDALKILRKNQAVFLVASEEDAYSYSTVEELARTPVDGDLQVLKLDDAGHGTTMFERLPQFMDEAAEWLAVRLKKT